MGTPPPEHSGQSRSDEPDAIRFPVHSSEAQTDLHSDSDDDTETTSLYSGNIRRIPPCPIVTDHRRFPSVGENDRDPVPVAEPGAEEIAEEKPVTWSSLPKKGQLAILTLARLSEPITQTSLQAYMFYQLKSFDPSLPDSTISAQAGLLQGSFTAAQFLTAVWWGRLADADWMGRKRVLMIGLFCTCVSALGFGFSRSFVTAAIFRTLGGALNSNQGVMRTMISEIIAEKKYVFHLAAIVMSILTRAVQVSISSIPAASHVF